MQIKLSLFQPFGGVLALIAGGLFIVALIVLGQAIGWPGILREPAPVVFPRIDANRTAMLIGYSAYLLSSLALIAVAFALRERLEAAGVDAALVNTLTFFGAAGGILKTLGIVRWLSAMPTLASQYVAATTPEARSVLEVSYAALNGYAGSVGELLGVQLVSGIWITGVSFLLIRYFRSFWVGGLGVATGVGYLIVAGRIFEPAIAAIQSIVNPMGLAWIISIGILLLRHNPKTDR